jgi:hypothetical protein
VGLPRVPDERVDQEARAADAHRVGDGQPEQADEAIHGCTAYTRDAEAEPVACLATKLVQLHWITRACA